MTELITTETTIRQQLRDSDQHTPNAVSPLGGGCNPTSYTAHRRVPTQLNGSPHSDRYVTLQSIRLFATDMYAVALVDGTGKLADIKSLTLTPDQDQARTAANQLLKRHGTATPPTSAYHYHPPGTYSRKETA